MKTKDKLIKRFVLIENDPRYPNDGETCWYADLARPIVQREGKSSIGHVAIQMYCDRDPNDYVPVKGEMYLLFTDQAEYCVVCSSCRARFAHMQWSGSTRNPNWREESRQYLDQHKKEKGWCEFCDPVFGNGGWIL